ncbi:hypothetical protein C0J52_23795 [Blattella germanica]|nr:hypothetical protein C0J52_23795 [Blattella germanica]
MQQKGLQGRNLQTLYHNIVMLLRHSFYLVTTRNVCKMADISVSFQQRAVIEFLVKEEQSAVDIHQRLQCAYGDACMGASSVRWEHEYQR